MGVGKNMVASIRYWMKAFGCIDGDKVTKSAEFFFNDKTGVDPFIENDTTLWILHYMLVKNAIASIYNLAFLEFRREKKEFTKEHLLQFLKRRCSGMPGGLNESSVKKDIGVFLQTYVQPTKATSLEDYTALLPELGLIWEVDKDRFAFAEVDSRIIPEPAVLFAICDYCSGEKTLSLDAIQDLALIFGNTIPGFISIVQKLSKKYSDAIAYSDNSGIKNIQFLKRIDVYNELKDYYAK